MQTFNVSLTLAVSLSFVNRHVRLAAKRARYCGVVIDSKIYIAGTIIYIVGTINIYRGLDMTK